MLDINLKLATLIIAVTIPAKIVNSPLYDILYEEFNINDTLGITDISTEDEDDGSQSWFISVSKDECKILEGGTDMTKLLITIQAIFDRLATGVPWNSMAIAMPKPVGGK